MNLSPDGPSGQQVLAAIAAIVGQTTAELAAAARDLVETETETGPSPASEDEVRDLIDVLATRLGLAPAVDFNEAQAHRAALTALLNGGGLQRVTLAETRAWNQLLRNTPEHVPTVDREPVALPPLPGSQLQMWQTLLAMEAVEKQPWVLVGGQMTMLHCLENGVAFPRATNDGDLVLGVWTRRDSLHRTSRFLRDHAFTEVATHDGYGYRFVRGDTAIDVLLPEGLERQRDYPTTISGRPGFSAEGGNQALSRAERVPISLGGVTGHVRRPSLLGAIVAKAYAHTADSRDKDRHLQDIVSLAGIALNRPRAVLGSAGPGDRRPVRRVLRTLTADHPLLRRCDDPAGVHALLKRLGGVE